MKDVFVDYCNDNQDVGLHLNEGDLTIKIPAEQFALQDLLLRVMQKAFEHHSESVEMLGAIRARANRGLGGVQ